MKRRQVIKAAAWATPVIAAAAAAPMAAASEGQKYRVTSTAKWSDGFPWKGVEVAVTPIDVATGEIPEWKSVVITFIEPGWLNENPTGASNTFTGDPVEMTYIYDPAKHERPVSVSWTVAVEGEVHAFTQAI